MEVDILRRCQLFNIIQAHNFQSQLPMQPEHEDGIYQGTSANTKVHRSLDLDKVQIAHDTRSSATEARTSFSCPKVVLLQ
jgi:hypothetical protein